MISHSLNVLLLQCSGGFSNSLLTAINAAGDADILFVAAAGNSNVDNDAGNYYPSNYQCDNNGQRGWDCVISVASITSSGAKSSFSSYGATTVDIGAPGSSIQSTVPTSGNGSGYASYSGTSMAVSHFLSLYSNALTFFLPWTCSSIL